MITSNILNKFFILQKMSFTEEKVFYVHKEREAQRLLALIRKEEENTKVQVLAWIRLIQANHIKNSKMVEVLTLTRHWKDGQQCNGGLVLVREKYGRNGERRRQRCAQINLLQTELPFEKLTTIHFTKKM